MRTLLVLAATLPATIAVAGPCKYHHDWSLAPELLTPAGATIDQLGGIVVAAVSTRDQNRGMADPTQQDWWFSDGKDHAVVARTVIAPGLTVHAPTLHAPELTLVYPPDHTTMLAVHQRHVDKAAALAMPKVKTVTYADHGLPIMARSMTAVELSEAAPARAVALVIYVGGKPRSWARIQDASALTVSVYLDNDCTVGIPGATASKTGEVATLAWLDDTGHLSARTAPIKIVAP